MRGLKVIKDVTAHLNQKALFKWLAVLYLLFCLASHLTTPTVAHYSHVDAITGEISVSNKLGSEPKGEEPIKDEETEEQNDGGKSDDAAEEKKEVEDKIAETDGTDNKEEEQNMERESLPEDEQEGAPVQPEAKSDAMEEEVQEEAP